MVAYKSTDVKEFFQGRKIYFSFTWVEAWEVKFDLSRKRVSSNPSEKEVMGLGGGVHTIGFTHAGAKCQNLIGTVSILWNGGNPRPQRV